MSAGSFICLILGAISIQLLYIAKWLQRIHEELRKIASQQLSEKS